MHSAFDLIGSYTGLLIFEVAGIDYCLNDSIVFSTVKPPFEISHGGKANGNEDRRHTSQRQVNTSYRSEKSIKPQIEKLFNYSIFQSNHCRNRK